MKISKVQSLLNATVLAGEEHLDSEVHSACGSDMMSDVLAYVKNQAVLLTGLVNPQVIKTAEMMDMRCIVFVRNKRPSPEMLKMANEVGITLLASDASLFSACGILYDNGLRGS